MRASPRVVTVLTKSQLSTPCGFYCWFRSSSISKCAHSVSIALEFTASLRRSPKKESFDDFCHISNSSNAHDVTHLLQTNRLYVLASSCWLFTPCTVQCAAIFRNPQMGSKPAKVRGTRGPPCSALGEVGVSNFGRMGCGREWF